MKEKLRLFTEFMAYQNKQLFELKNKFKKGEETSNNFSYDNKEAALSHINISSPQAFYDCFLHGIFNNKK